MSDRKPRRPRVFKPWRWIAAYRYPLLFGVTLVALAALVAWWAIFISRSLDERHQSRLKTLDLEARVYSLMLGHASSSEMARGALQGADSRLNLGPCAEEPQPMTYKLLPRMEDVCISPRPEVLAEFERDYSSKRLMIVGEATLSVVLIVLIGFMLLKLVASENRSAREIRLLWSRVTHELKTPISGLKAFLQTLQNQELSREELEPLLAMALAEVERQERLAENLLVGQRLGGFVATEPGEVEVVPFLRDYLAGQEYRLKKEQVRLNENCPEGARARVGAGALRIILDNLVDNSIKYCDKPGLEMTFTVAAVGEWINIIISDNGSGFAPTDAERIFRAYSRLSEEASGGRGTGMGMHISRRLARELGGELEASSMGPGQGAEFSLWLPVKKG